MKIKRSLFWALHSLITLTLLACFIVLITGCTTTHSPRIDEAFMHVKIVDEPGEDWPPRTAAITRGLGSRVSQIEVLRGYYPECITHEVRHVFEGDWHPGRNETCR